MIFYETDPYDYTSLEENVEQATDSICEDCSQLLEHCECLHRYHFRYVRYNCSAVGVDEHAARAQVMQMLEKECGETGVCDINIELIKITDNE
jgi:hypothetical protein